MNNCKHNYKNKPDCKNKQSCNRTVESKLAEVGLTVEEVHEWLDSEREEMERQAFFGFMQDVAKAEKENYSYSKPLSRTGSNLVLKMGDDFASTKVLIDGVELTGIIHANLKINPEAQYPVLYLEIFNPKVTS